MAVILFILSNIPFQSSFAAFAPFCSILLPPPIPLYFRGPPIRFLPLCTNC